VVKRWQLRLHHLCHLLCHWGWGLALRSCLFHR
jgi:hypothetical protein